MHVCWLRKLDGGSVDQLSFFFMGVWGGTCPMYFDVLFPGRLKLPCGASHLVV